MSEDGTMSPHLTKPILLMLLLVLYSVSIAWGQAAGDAQALYDEGEELFTKASSRGDMEKALQKFELALAECQKTGKENGESWCLGYIGLIYDHLSEYHKALDYFEKSLEISRRLGDLQYEGVTLTNIGAVYASWSQYAKALEYYEKSLEIRRKVGDGQGEGVVLNNIGVVYESWGQPEKALDYYEKSLEISKRVGDLSTEGVTLNRMGSVFRLLGQYNKALDYLDKSLEIARKLGDDRSQGLALNHIGLVYGTLGQYAKALEYDEKSLEIARKLGDVRTEGATLSNIGVVYGTLGQYAKALEYYEKSLEIKRKIGDVSGEGVTLNNMGLVYVSWSQYAKALEYYEKSLGIRIKIGDVPGEGVTLNNIGEVYRSWGQYAKAVEYYEKSLEIRRKVGDIQGDGVTLNNIGLVYQSWGQYEKAVEYYENSLGFMGKLGDVRGEGVALNNMGLVYRAWGQYTKAVEYYKKSLGIMGKLGDVRGEGVALQNIALIYMAINKYDEALADLKKAADIYTRIGVSISGVNDLIGQVYLEMGDIATAEPYIREANYDSSIGRLCLLKSDFPEAKNRYEKLLEWAETNRNADNLFTAYTGLGMALEGMGDNAGAAEYFRKAIDLTEDIRSGLSPSERAEFYNVKVQGFYRTAPYEGLARVLIKLNKPPEAFQQSEYTKARMFAEGLSKRAEGSVPQIPIDVLDTDSQLSEQLAALMKNLQKAYEKHNKEAIAVLEPQVKQAKGKLAAHVDMLRRDCPLFASTKYPKPMGLEQTALKDDEWVLAYHVTDSGIIIYLTKGKHLIKGLFKPVAEKKVDELVHNFRQPLEVGPKDSPENKLASFDFNSGKRLSELLLADILPELPRGAPVIIIPDGPLGMLPFEMLVLNDKGTVKTDKSIPYISDAEFFGDRNLISYYQSITALTLARMHAKPRSVEKGLLVMADPVFLENDKRMEAVPQKNAPTGVLASLLRQLNLMAAKNNEQIGGLHFSRLALTSDLAKSLAEIQKDSDVYTGLDASKSNFLDNISPSLNRYDKIVFATHGYFGKDLPGIMEPVLVLTLVPPGTDGFLRMTEVLGLNMNADIVALTACQTGVGKRVSGEGTMGMGRAFQYAGAKSVLMSLWSVSELTSVNLVKDFFRYLKEGKNKLEALALARKKVRSKGYDHPFFWAPFILVGEVN